MLVIVSGGQHRDSTTHVHVSILPQTLLPSRLPRNPGQGSLCHTGGHCWLSVLNITLPSQPQYVSEFRSRFPSFSQSLKRLQAQETPGTSNPQFLTLKTT